MKNRKLLTLLLVLVMLLSFTGCAAASKAEMQDSAYNGYGSAAAPESADTVFEGVVKEAESTLTNTGQSGETASAALPENRKLIQTFRISAETEDMNTLLTQLNSQIAQLSGYVEGQNVYNGSAYSGKRYRNAELTIRIPADQVESFVNQVSQIANVVSSNKTVEDITLQYVSTESRMKALQTEETRLLELLAKAETMDDLLTIEKRLTEVRYELESVTSSLRVYDNRVDYATVYLSVSEVKEYTVVDDPETVGERISAGWKETVSDLKEGFEDFIVGVVVNFPYLLMWAAVITVVILLVIRHKKKKARKKAAQQQKSE